MDISCSSLCADQPLAGRFDWLIELLLVALLAFCPLAFGAWSEQVVIGLAAAVSIVFLAKLLICRDTRVLWSWAYVPVALFVLIVAVQLARLPSEVVGVVSPETAALKTDLLGRAPDVEPGPASMTLSFYPRATRQGLRLVLAVGAVFVVMVNVYRELRRIKRLLAAIAIIGGAIALLALAQDVAGNGRIYGVVPTYDQARSGPFINPGHFGPFMNLSIGAALALLLMQLHIAFADRPVIPAHIAEYVVSPASRTAKWLLATIVVGAIAVLVSPTRGGAIGMLAAVAFVTLVLCSRPSLNGRAWAFVLVAIGALICVFWVGFEEAYDRLASLREVGAVEGGHWQTAKAAVATWAKFPVLGTGLGTYEVVHPMFDRSNTAALATHAQNQYIQTLVETGALGFGTLAGFGIIIWVNFVRSVKIAFVPVRLAACGLAFGLLAIQIYGLSDFGQHLPANAILAATVCALLVGLSREDRVRPVRARGAMGMVFVRAGRLAGLVLTVAVFGWAVLGANDARLAEAHWDKALATEGHLRARDWRGDRETYDHLLTHAHAAVVAEPDDITYRHGTAVYEWFALIAEYDRDTGQLDARGLVRARWIVDELHDARRCCPTFGPTPCVAGEIEQFVLNDPIGAEHIALGYRLAPCNATVCFAAGKADAVNGNIERAMDELGRAIRLDGECFTQALALCIDDLARPDLAIRLAGDNIDRLSRVANLLAMNERCVKLVEQIRIRIARVVEERSHDPDAPAWMQVFMAGREAAEGKVESAIQRYRVALEKDYGQIRWHCELARLLARTGRVREAMKETRICLRFQPDYCPAKRLIEELSIVPSGAERPYAAESGF